MFSSDFVCSRLDVAMNFPHEAASARTGLGEVALPTEGHPVVLKEARPSSAYFAPSEELDVCLPPSSVNDHGYTTSASVLARSVSLTNLNAEDERYYKAGAQYHDGPPVPFDLRLPKVSCNDNNIIIIKNNKSECKEEDNGERHIETPSSNNSATLGHVMPFPNDDWASKRTLFPDPESGKWMKEDSKNTDVVFAVDPIVIDLTSEADPRPLLSSSSNQEGGEEERYRKQASHSGSPPVLKSIKNEYERRLEMYERLSKVSKIKDQEIAILEGERRRVRSELECLKNIFLKASLGQSQATTTTEGVGGVVSVGRCRRRRL